MSDKDEQVNGELSAHAQQMAELLKEQKKWMELVEAADTEKSRLLLDKMDTDDAKKKAQQETTDLLTDQEQLSDDFKKKLKDMQEEMKRLDKDNQDLLKKLDSNEEKLKLKKAEMNSLQQRFKIKSQVPVKKLKFTKVEDKETDMYDESEVRGQSTKAVFTITQRPSVLMKGGQALLTFEDEKVAEQVLKLAKCSVVCDKAKVDVKPAPVSLEPSVKFEVHIEVSKKTIQFSSAPLVLPEERMRDRLELSFSKPSLGGGEIDRIDYDPKTGTGRVTFSRTGVAENLVSKKKFYADIGQGLDIEVAPLYEYQLRKFQTFIGVPKRTVLLKGIQDVTDEEDLQDHLEIHFQKPSNYGGEVESIKYLSAGKELKAFFVEDCEEEEEGQ